MDDDFERDPSTLIAVAKPPYYTMKLYPGSAMTTGGPKKNLKAQVLDPFNSPIPHLYCVGEMGVAYGVVYPMPGINIGEFLIFGRVAGENDVNVQTPSSPLVILAVPPRRDCSVAIQSPVIVTSVALGA
jgi:succinate dehydrogenase/fumarate reductase flavoprotein subunit